MKKLLFVSLFLIPYSLFVSPVLAKNPLAPGPIWKEVKADVKDEQQEIKQEIREAVKAEVKGAKQEVRSDIAHIHAEHLKQRFLGIYYPKLDSLVQKIQAKITSMNDSGKDMTSSQAKLDEAKAALATAKTQADAAISGFEAIDPASYSVQRQQALQARDQAKNARANFVATIKLLKDTLKLMRAAQ